MTKRKITIIKSQAVPLPIEDIDTDQIIPARFLKATTREGFGKNLFRDWRYHSDGMPKKEFVLNNPKYKGKILVAGRNFGCGSSREHAAWALSDYGFHAVISSFFADIFKNNALNNSLLPLQVSDSFLKVLLRVIQKNPKTQIVIDLPNQKIAISSMKKWESFAINAYKKLCLIEGLNDIDYLLRMRRKVAAFEKKRKNDYSIV